MKYIKKKFLKLTSETVPYGTEDKLKKYLPLGTKKDQYGNYYISIGENYSTMFTCHLDTACKEEVKVNHVIDGKYIKTDGTSILGADDKAGMTVMLYMISKNVPGLYYFFIGEEVGCIGSSDLSKTFKMDNIKKVISFDRRGLNSVITEQLYGVCCSDEFALALANQLNESEPTFNYELDDTGICTDSIQFQSLVPECTNISVGYYNEHKNIESQDIEHLVKLCKACVKVDWESLPIKREPSEYDMGGKWWYGNTKKKKKKKKKVAKYDLDLDIDLDNLDLGLDELGIDFDIDEDDLLSLNLDDNEEEEEWSNYNYFYKGNEKQYVSKNWIKVEKEKIMSYLKLVGYSPINVMWDGHTAYFDTSSTIYNYIGTREQLIHLIHGFGSVPKRHLKKAI